MKIKNKKLVHRIFPIEVKSLFEWSTKIKNILIKGKPIIDLGLFLLLLMGATILVAHL